MTVYALAPDYDFGNAGLVGPLTIIRVVVEHGNYFDGYIEDCHDSNTLHSFKWSRCYHLNERGNWLRMEQLP